MIRQKGFTLVEAAVAIGVVFLLSGILVPIVLRNIEDARVARAHNDIDVIAGSIAMQMRTFGRRPTGNAGGGGDARADAIWFSNPAHPTVMQPLAGPVAGAPAAGVMAAAANQTFVNLFNGTPGNGQTLFGTPANGPFSYQGPYMPLGLHPTDPWGRAYLILGYNANGQGSNGPVWIVSAGPQGTIGQANLAVAANRYPNLWDYGVLGSARNIAVRIN